MADIFAQLNSMLGPGVVSSSNVAHNSTANPGANVGGVDLGGYTPSMGSTNETANFWEAPITKPPTVPTGLLPPQNTAPRAAPLTIPGSPMQVANPLQQIAPMFAPPTSQMGLLSMPRFSLRR